MSRASLRWLTILMGAVLLQAVAAPGRRVVCGVDLEALRTYLRAGEGTGTVVGAPLAGQRLYAHLDYRVKGAAAAPTAHLVALVDGTPVCATASFEFQLGFAETVFCQQPWTATAGTHTLRWEIDPTGELAETDETNNVAETTFTVAQAAAVDLDARRTYLRTGFFDGPEVPHPSVGQDVYLHLDCSVTGSQTAVTADLSAVVDGQTYCSGPVEFQPGGTESFGCNQPWHAIAGVHTIAWVLDASETVPEADESNNIAQLSLQIPAPAGIDFQALRASLRTQPAGGGEEVSAPACGQSIYFHFNFGLTGTSEPVAVPLRAEIDGLPECLGVFPAQGDANATYCATAWIAAPGHHALRLDIDSTNQIRETDEGNNTVELSFDVGGAAACAGDCDGDGTVGIAELVKAVNVALGALPVSDCVSLDTNNDGNVSISELIAGVKNALNGCA